MTPEPWRTSAAGPFVTIEQPRGTVGICALGEDRFRVVAPDREDVVVGHDTADELVHRLANELA